MKLTGEITLGQWRGCTEANNTNNSRIEIEQTMAYFSGFPFPV